MRILFLEFCANTVHCIRVMSEKEFVPFLKLLKSSLYVSLQLRDFFVRYYKEVTVSHGVRAQRLKSYTVTDAPIP